MPVTLVRSLDRLVDTAVSRIAVIGDAGPLAGHGHHGMDPASDLERAFDEIADDWWQLGRALGEDSTAGLSHAAACVTNASDLGEMMAWTRLIETWALADEEIGVVCWDPWLYRHLAGREGVRATERSVLWPAALVLALRGYAARAKAALEAVRAALALRSGTERRNDRAAALLVYGHPISDAAGKDGYFGDLMSRLPELDRVLHIDCRPARARELSRDGRTASLHAWGSPLYALTLPFRRWRPNGRHCNGRHGTLVRRAGHTEGSRGQAARIAWQNHCQARWLAAVRPGVVAWPWENHAWERAFVRTARKVGVRTIGYQHSVIGRQMLNYAPRSNVNGVDGLPDRIVCTGATTRDQLIRWGVPPERLLVGGALRFVGSVRVRHDPSAPVFMALPFDGAAAAEMVAAAEAVASVGRPFLVKDHPMTPFVFASSAFVKRVETTLAEQAAVSAVVYAATTVGLEAILAGIPTLRFRPARRIAIDILPAGIQVPVTGGETLAGDLERLSPPEVVDRESIFADASDTLWHELLQTANGTP